MQWMIQLPLPPKELHPNGRTKSAQYRQQLRSRYRDEAAEHAKCQMLEKRGGVPRVDRAFIELEYNFKMPSRGGPKRHDPDNLIAWAKSAIDALTLAGVLRDDRQLTFLPPQQHWIPRANDHDLTADELVHPCLVVRLVQVEPGYCPFCGQSVPM